jgi:hypothetical protein
MYASICCRLQTIASCILFIDTSVHTLCIYTAFDEILLSHCNSPFLPTLRVLFYKNAKSGQFTLEDLKKLMDNEFERDDLPFGADFLTDDLLHEVFEVARPGCNGVILADELQYISHDKWKKIHNIMQEAEREYLADKVEEFEMEGIPIPSSLVLEDSESDSEGRSSHGHRDDSDHVDGNDDDVDGMYSSQDHDDLVHEEL